MGLKKLPYELKASFIAFTIGVGGFVWLSYQPRIERNYNPLEVRTPTAAIIDADRDGDVDIIERKDRGTLVADDMVDWLSNNAPNSTFISLCPRINSELQEAANKRLQGEDGGNFERILAKTYK